MGKDGKYNILCFIPDDDMYDLDGKPDSTLIDSGDSPASDFTDVAVEAGGHTTGSVFYSVEKRKM